MPPPIRAAAALDISYRPITDDDLSFLFEVYGSTRAEELAATGWPLELKLDFLYQQFSAQHAHYQQHYPNAEWLIVSHRGQAAGRLYVEEWPSELRLIDISILPAFRGLGIGTAILSDIQDWASSKDKPLTIHVEKENRAHSLYRRLGFSAIGGTGVYDLLEWRK